MRIASFLIIALIVSAAGGLGVASTIASGYDQLRDIEEGNRSKVCLLRLERSASFRY
jgi:hypothetical protein